MSRFVLTAQLQLQAPNNVAQVVRQIQSQLNGVTVNLQVQGAPQAQRQIQQVTQNVQQATTAAERMGRAFAVSVRRFAAFSIATRAVGLFTSTLSDAVQTAINFERQLIKVSQVTGKSVGQLRDLTSEITRLSTGLGVSSDSLLEVSTVLAQAGLSADDTKVALNALAKAALAPNFDSITETAEGAIAILAQFKQGVGALESQLGSINAVAGAFAVEASDLIDVVRRTGGVFKSSGGNLNELLALFTSVRATTRESAESIGTGLRTIFTRIQRPKTIEFLKQFGVELVDLEGKFVGPYEAIRRLSEGLAGLGEGDITFIKIAEELGGFRQIGKVLPLLQQFATAEAALNVATKANNSLTSDAVSAQAALAIRIMKVKEEFLALIRSITETSTFQIFANTALSLASALIKISDAIKPLLPLLAALSAIKLTRSIGGFLGGIGGGLTSARTFSQGGRVHKFARGGMVPGTGNGDTVPAMLQPGEFVIRKSSVNRLGAGTLHAMNENRFNTGRKVDGITKTGLRGKPEKRDAFSQKVIQKAQTGTSTVQFDVNPNAIGAFVLQPAKGTDGYYKAQNPEIFTLPPNNRYAQLFAKQNGLTIDDLGAGVKAQINPASYPVFYPGLSDRADLSKTAQYQQAVSKGVRDAITTGVNSTIQSVKSAKLLDIPPAFDTNEELMQNTIGKILADQQVTSSIEGYMFESMISAFSGANAAGGRSNFDFAKSAISGNRVKLKALFGNNPIMDSLVKAEAKRSYGEVGGNIQRKLANDIIEGNKAGVTLKTSGSRSIPSVKKFFGGLIHKFAAGGDVGTDTVPALLTPGEFVVNRASAQRIGYSNLNRMNKVGKYAKGGVVQHFAAGTSGSGAKPILSNFAVPGFDTKAPTTLNKIIAKLTGTFSIMDITLQQGAKQFTLLKTITPNLSKAITNYANTNNLTMKQMAQLSGAYSQIVGQMLKQGATNSEISARMQTYIDALEADTQAKQNAAKASRAATAAMGGGTPNTSNPRPTPMGSPGSIPGMTNNTSAINANTQAQRNAAQSAVDVIKTNKMFAVAMATSLIQGFLPAIDENSSNLLIFSQQILSTAVLFTAVATGLEALGISLSRNAIAGAIDGAISAFDSLKTNGILNTIQSLFAQTTATAAQTTSVAANTTAVNANTAAQQLQASGSQKLAAGLQAGAIATALVSAAFYTLFGAIKESARLEKERATKLGDVSGAGEAAATEAGAGVRQTFSTVGAVIGGAIGTIGGAIAGGSATGAATLGVGAVPGAVIGGAAGGAAGAATGGGIGLTIAEFAGYTQAAADAARLSAEVAAQKVKTDKIMEEATTKASSAMEDFTKGTISAQEALKAGEQGALAVRDFIGKVKETNVTAEKAASQRYFGRAGAEKKAKQEGELRLQDAQKMSQEQLRTMMPAMQASMRSTAVTGGDFDDFISSLSEAQFEILNFADGGIENAYRSFLNLQKELEKTRALLDAMNLGLRGPTATATAMSASMDKFAAGLEVGGDMFGANVEFLSKAVSGAAQALDPDEIKSAVTSVRKELEGMGVSKNFAIKFEENANAFVEAQKKYNTAFNKITDDIKQRRKRGESVKTDAETLKDSFAKELTAGLGDDAKANLTAIINSIELSPTEVEHILGGNLQVFGDKLGEAGKKQFEEIMKIAEERQKAEQVIINLTKQRADAERNLLEAQRQAVDLRMEGREVQGKYGGKAVTPTERRNAILEKANFAAGAKNIGLSNINSDTVLADLKTRRKEIGRGFQDIEARRQVEGGMERVGGVQADEKQKNLDAAFKNQIQTVRDLIKVEEEQLKITQEKNKLEKQSMESLINGDIEKFFDQQAAVGATAAIATGNQDLMNAFGATALSGAYSDIERQKEAGVQEIYGQRIAGPGGLGEQAAGAALGARGVQNPAAVQILAGTTPEEEASNQRLRALGEELGQLGQLGIDMAEMQLNTADVNVQNATINLEKINEQGKKAADEANAVAGGMRRGGIVYASRGIFVPRGTDTIPAMLTPGEFVVRREAVNRGNNLQLLQAMNNGMSGSAGAAAGVQNFARGGKVQYLAGGGLLNGIVQNILGTDVISMLTKALTTFTSQMSDTIKSLQDTKFKITLDSTNVNVNITGNSGMLAGLTQEARNEIAKIVSDKIKNTSVGSGGKLVENTSTMPKG